jgi:hypothetical protein
MLLFASLQKCVHLTAAVTIRRGVVAAPKLRTLPVVQKVGHEVAAAVQ